MSNRVFKYGENTYEDPGEQYTVEQVRTTLTQYFPELAAAIAEEKTLEDGTVQITFVKKAGTKGGDTPPGVTWDAHELAARIAATPPLHLRAIEILITLEGEVSPAQFVALQPEIEAAERQLSDHVRLVNRATTAICDLAAVPARRAPVGF